ncbi:uncharacterized protein LOC111046528 [Nilaparvata lugens]|uniref:uncharacterized protein LOC111046528 n=1 Tax=Nilaparvata lugens TaxID=108931 RepID=UPI00193E8CB6|nr:uncharacterized protein LOC111046528 [Nilaparvata lugens]
MTALLWGCLGLVTFSFFLIDSCSGACEGYSLHDVKVKACEGTGDDLINVTNYKVNLTSNCRVIPTGCIQILKDIEKFSIDYELNKNGITLKQGKIKNGCYRLENSDNDIQLILDAFNFIGKCPVKAGKSCADRGKSINIQKHSMVLPAALGKISGKISLKTNVGNACFEYEVNISFNGMQAGKSVIGRLPKIGK